MRRSLVLAACLLSVGCATAPEISPEFVAPKPPVLLMQTPPELQTIEIPEEEQEVVG